jgi:hypothetical protein
MEILNKIVWYFSPGRKADSDLPQNTNIRFMHGINRISLLMFAGAMIFLLVRAALR